MTISTSGTHTRYLLEGPHEDKYVLLEIENNELVAASDMHSREEINIEEIAAIDIEKAVEFLQHPYHGTKN